jgi:hypothetical protein
VTPDPRIAMIWGQASSGVIGTMPWHLPEDFKHFRSLTAGQPVIMGRRTWDSLPEKSRPLPGRTNIVITGQRGWAAAGALRASNLSHALELGAGVAGPNDRLWIIGGGRVYNEAMNVAGARPGGSSEGRESEAHSGPKLQAVIKIPVVDEDEIQYSRWIMLLFAKADSIESALEPLIDPAEGSPLFLDDVRSPHHTVSSYAFGQLSVATGCISSLKEMMVRETDDHVSLMASAFGAYALVRNALDATAAALWLLEPVNGTLRIKRRILLGIDEVGKGAALRETMGQPSIKTKRRARLKEVAAQAGLGDWNPLSKELPSMTRMLKQLERLHENAIFPWLAAWQLSSGHAHGKSWAQLASNELQEVQGTRSATGAKYQMTIRFGMLAAVLFEAVQMLEVASIRYIVLAGGPQTSSGV